MAFKLIESAQDRWRAMNMPTWLPSTALAPVSNAANSSDAPARTRCADDAVPGARTIDAVTSQALYERFAADYPQLAAYQAQTTRQIPLVILTRRLAWAV
jgi:hypothetical protein